MSADVQGVPKDGPPSLRAAATPCATESPRTDDLILLTRLNGPAFALNPDLIERADATPDTVITLVDGTKYVVGESLADLVTLIRQYRASVVSDAQQLVSQPAEGRREAVAAADGAPADEPGTNVVQLHRRER
jgi:flagellar protein FlbD